MPYSFNVAKNVIDQMVNVSDQEMINYMIYAFKNLKIIIRTCLCSWFCSVKKIKFF